MASLLAQKQKQAVDVSAFRAYKTFFEMSLKSPSGDITADFQSLCQQLAAEPHPAVIYALQHPRVCEASALDRVPEDGSSLAKELYLFGVEIHVHTWQALAALLPHYPVFIAIRYV